MPHPNLDPELSAGLAAAPVKPLDVTGLTYAELPRIRAERAALWPVVGATDAVSVEDHQASGIGGAPDVPVRVYRPVGRQGPLPALYWIHGGGMIAGGIAMDDGLMHRYATEVGCVAVSVEYRLAPEHPYPAPVDDCYAGLRWTADNAGALGIDRARIAISGASAGGGLAAATALLARDRGGPRLAYQLLLSPMLDDRNASASSREFTQRGMPWNRAANLFGWAALLRGTTEVSPYAAPARANDLSGLPPTFLDAAELEVFRDECFEYAHRLTGAGVSTEFHLYPGACHGWDALVPDAAVSRRAVAARIAALRRALRDPRG
jgi:acetyl esterase/lipase